MQDDFRWIDPNELWLVAFVASFPVINWAFG